MTKINLTLNNIMKNAIFIILLFNSYNSNAQFWRTIDLNLRLLDPITSEESKLDFATPGEIPCRFSITNQGPDTIYPNDTIVFRESKYFYYTDQRTILYSEFGDTLFPGDSILYNYTVISDIWENYQFASIRFQLNSRSHSTRKTMFTEVGEVVRDNIRTVYINLKRNTSVNNLNLNPNYAIFPNPFHESISIKNLNLNLFKWEIIDIMGKTLINHTNYNNDDFFEINLSSLNQSIYFLKIIESNGNVFTIKLVKN